MVSFDAEEQSDEESFRSFPLQTGEQILRSAQDDRVKCHSERSEESFSPARRRIFSRYSKGRPALSIIYHSKMDLLKEENPI